MLCSEIWLRLAVLSCCLSKSIIKRDHSCSPCGVECMSCHTLHSKIEEIQKLNTPNDAIRKSNLPSISQFISSISSIFCQINLFYSLVVINRYNKTKSFISPESERFKSLKSLSALYGPLPSAKNLSTSTPSTPDLILVSDGDKLQL